MSDEKKPESPAAAIQLGKIAVESPNGVNYSGVKAMEFTTAAAMNEWAEQNFGTMVVQVVPLADGSVLAFVAKILSDEEIQEMADINAIVAEEKERRKMARQAAEIEARNAADKAAEERRELEKLGRNCRDNHGAVMDDNAKLRKEVKTLKSKLNK